MKPPALEPLAIAGTGRAARALAKALVGAGREVRLWGRDAARCSEAAHETGAQSFSEESSFMDGVRLLLVAVRDDALASVAQRLAVPLSRAQPPDVAVALHLAGAWSRDVLMPLAAQGLATGVFHPAVALGGSGAAEALRGATATISGDAHAIVAARALAVDLGMDAVEVDDRARPLVHLACVLAAGDLVTLLGFAEDLLVQGGVERGSARGLAAALARSAVEGYRLRGPIDGLTGPAARGDAETLARHTAALADAGLASSAAARAHGALVEAAQRLLTSAGREPPDAAGASDLPPGPSSARNHLAPDDDPQAPSGGS